MIQVFPASGAPFDFAAGRREGSATARKGIRLRRGEGSATSEARAAAARPLGRQDTLKVLAVMFDRVYVLRNQLIHGGATWGGAINRQQIRDGAAILGALVPIVIHLMLEAPDQLWGEPNYPVVE